MLYLVCKLLFKKNQNHKPQNQTAQPSQNHSTLPPPPYWCCCAWQIPVISVLENGSFICRHKFRPQCWPAMDLLSVTSQSICDCNLRAGMYGHTHWLVLLCASKMLHLHQYRVEQRAWNFRVEVLVNCRLNFGVMTLLSFAKPGILYCG